MYAVYLVGQNNSPMYNSEMYQQFTIDVHGLPALTVW